MLQTFLIFDDLQSFEKNWSGILQKGPLLGFVWCFSHGVMRFVEADLYIKMYRIIWKVHTINILRLLMLTLTTWLKEYLSGFFTAKLFTPHLFFYTVLLRRSHNVQLRNEKLCSPGEYFRTTLNHLWLLSSSQYLWIIGSSLVHTNARPENYLRETNERNW